MGNLTNYLTNASKSCMTKTKSNSMELLFHLRELDFLVTSNIRGLQKLYVSGESNNYSVLRFAWVMVNLEESSIRECLYKSHLDRIATREIKNLIADLANYVRLFLTKVTGNKWPLIKFQNTHI